MHDATALLLPRPHGSLTPERCPSHWVFLQTSGRSTRTHNFFRIRSAPLRSHDDAEGLLGNIYVTPILRLTLFCRRAGNGMTDATARQYDAYGVAVVYVGSESRKASRFIGSDVYTEYTFRLSAACLCKDVDGHIFRVRYSQARRSHDEIVRSSSLCSDGQLPDLQFPSSFPLRDMTTVDSVNERAADLCAYYNRVVALEGALASAAVRRAIGLEPVTEAAVLTAAELYFGSVAAVKARFARLGGAAAESCDDCKLQAALPQAISLGAQLLLDSREEIARYNGMPIMADEEGVSRHVRLTLSSVALASQLSEIAALDWASFEIWWKAECLEPVAAAARRALVDHVLPVPRDVEPRFGGEVLLPQKCSAVSDGPAPEVELERVQALLSAESQARQQAQADLEEMRRVLAQERSQWMGTEQRHQDGGTNCNDSFLSPFLESSPGASASASSGLSTDAEEVSSDPPPQWQPRTDAGRILPSPSNLLNESGSAFGVHLAGVSTSAVVGTDAGRSGGASQQHQTSLRADATRDDRDDELIVVRSGRRKSKAGNTPARLPGKSLLARTLFEEQRDAAVGRRVSPSSRSEASTGADSKLGTAATVETTVGPSDPAEQQAQAQDEQMRQLPPDL